uniref:Uncharacterized protein n=1 Tax=Glossina austeni TaxID=7395 RepID=A0A1A9VUE1_GLOAU
MLRHREVEKRAVIVTIRESSVLSNPFIEEIPTFLERLAPKCWAASISTEPPPPPSLPTRVRKIPSRITSAAAPLPSPLPTLYAKHSLRSLCLGLKLIVLLTSFIIFLIKLPVLLGTAGFVKFSLCNYMII